MKRSLALAATMLGALFISSMSQAAVIATVSSTNTINDDDAWVFFNDTPLEIAQIVLQAAPPVSLDPMDYYAVNSLSDAVGETQSQSNAASGDNFYTVTFDFSDFDAGETFIFGLDTDGAGSGAANIAAVLEIMVTFVGGGTNSAMFNLAGFNTATASVSPTATQFAAVPEPGTLALLGLGLGVLVGMKRRKRA